MRNFIYRLLISVILFAISNQVFCKQDFKKPIYFSDRWLHLQLQWNELEGKIPTSSYMYDPLAEKDEEALKAKYGYFRKNSGYFTIFILLEELWEHFPNVFCIKQICELFFP